MKWKGGGDNPDPDPEPTVTKKFTIRKTVVSEEGSLYVDGTSFGFELVTDTVGTSRFTLSDDEEQVFDLPVGTNYTVTEVDSGNADSVMYSFLGEREVEGTSFSYYIVDYDEYPYDEDIQFINTYNKEDTTPSDLKIDEGGLTFYVDDSELSINGNLDISGDIINDGGSSLTLYVSGTVKCSGTIDSSITIVENADIDLDSCNLSITREGGSVFTNGLRWEEDDSFYWDSLIAEGVKLVAKKCYYFDFDNSEMNLNNSTIDINEGRIQTVKGISLDNRSNIICGEIPSCESIKNSGSSTITTTGNNSITCSGGIYNYASSTITSDSSIVCDQFLHNDGVIVNKEFIQVGSEFINNGTISSDLRYINSRGTFINTGVIDVTDSDYYITSSSFENQGTISECEYISCDGTVVNNSKGNILRVVYYIKCGTLSVEGGTIRVGGSVTANEKINVLGILECTNIEVQQGDLINEGIIEVSGSNGFLKVGGNLRDQGTMITGFNEGSYIEADSAELNNNLDLDFLNTYIKLTGDLIIRSNVRVGGYVVCSNLNIESGSLYVGDYITTENGKQDGPLTLTGD